LLIVAPDYQPKFVTKVDPATGPMRVSLVPKSLRGLGPRQNLMGRIVDGEGKPVEGAKVEFEWVETNDGQGCGGVCDEWGVEPLAVSDGNGEFILTAKKPFDRMTVSVEARGLAKGKFQKLASGTEHVLRLGAGVTVAGRVVKGGKGVVRTTVGLVSVARTIEDFTGDYDIGTDDEGHFAFPTIPPGREYYVYTLMKDAQQNGGVASVRKIKAGKDGEITSVGDLVVEPAFRIAGRLVLAGGAPLPAGARIMLGREEAWDTLPNVDVAADGRFVFEGVPKESVSVSPRLKGYRLSLRNPSLDRLNGFSVVGRVEENIDDLVILLEPGEFRHDYRADPGPDPQPYNKPIRSFQGPVPGNAP
jgi:hypothetical protein